MIDTSRSIAALQREFPQPRINPAWIQACAQALIDDGQESSLANLRHQYLNSDLSSSALPTGLIPLQAHRTTIFPTPTLLQIVSITEIASSAFQLQTVAEQRKEVLSGATRIRRIGDVQAQAQDGDGAEGMRGRSEDKEEKLPAFPRGMLKVQLSDGERVIAAVEYRRLEGIALGETKLGAKVLLHNVQALRGILMLAPENTKFLGYENAQLEDEQPTQFHNSLLRRMNKPVPGEEPMPMPTPGVPPTAARPAQGASGASRRLTLPPRASRPLEGPPAGPSRSRTRTVSISSSTAPSITGVPGPAVPSPYFAPGPGGGSVSARPARNARTAAQARITTLYDQTEMTAGPTSAGNGAGAGPTRRVSTSASSSKRPAQARIPHTAEHQEDEVDFYDDSFIRQIEAVERSQSQGAGGSIRRPGGLQVRRDRPVDGSSEYDYGDEGLDDSFLGQVDELERQHRRSESMSVPMQYDVQTVASGAMMGGRERVGAGTGVSRGAAAAGAPAGGWGGGGGGKRRKGRVMSEDKENYPDYIEVVSD